MVSRLIRYACKIGILGCWVATAVAQTPYKEFKRTAQVDPFFTLIGDKNGGLTITSPRLSAAVITRTTPIDSLWNDTVLVLPNEVSFHADRVTAGNMDFLFGEIVDIRIENRQDSSAVIFYTSHDSSRSISRMRTGNIISPFSAVHVDSARFVRGSIFTVTAPVTVEGEVNRDVVTLFGRISSKSGGVIRGGTVALFGQLDISKESTVYGSLISPRRKLMRKFQILSRDRELNLFEPNLAYNRVDGLALSLGVDFHDDDSLLPSFWASGGYAFESERWRYRFGMEQTISRSAKLSVGAEAYRQLASDDDWILSNTENLAFVIFAREDFKDYYEAQGGRLYARYSPLAHTTIGVEYRNEATKWLDAHPRLWAIFGGHKRFRDNFSTVPTTTRTAGMSDIDTTSLAGLSCRLEFDSRSKVGVYTKSAWNFVGTIERSVEGLGSDFDFTRYTLSLTRYQLIHKESMLLLKARFGGSEGDLPIHRRYYLGGLGSIEGLAHKKYSGEAVFTTSAEYRLTIPGSDFSLSTFWDQGTYSEISDSTHHQSKFPSSIHSIGLAGYIGSSVRISVAKPLGHRYGDKAIIFVRLAHHL